MSNELWSDERIMERWHELTDDQPTTTYDLVHMRDVAREVRDEYEAELAKLRAALRMAREIEYWDTH